MYFGQGDVDIRCEWGLAGVEALSPTSDVVIIVDVLSFSTSVDIAAVRAHVRWAPNSEHPSQESDYPSVRIARNGESSISSGKSTRPRRRLDS